MRFNKKILLGLLSLIVVFSFFASQMNTARAGFPTSELASLPQAINFIWDQRQVIIERIKDIAINDLIQRNVAMYMDNLSYNLAMQLGTGAPGQEKLIEVRDWKEVFQKSNEAVVGNLIGDINELGFDQLGLNLCDPSIGNVQMKLTIPLYIIDSKAPPRPTCNWNSIKANWKQFDQGLQDDLLILQLQPTTQRRGAEDRPNYDDPGGQSAMKNYMDFWEGFSYSQSDFGIIMEVRDELKKREEEAEKAKQAEIAQCGRYKDNKTPIDKQTITTCTQLLQLTEAQAKEAFAATAEKQAGNTAGGETTDNAYMKILKDAANRFVNTYSSRLMKEWFTGGVFTAGTNQIRDGARYLGDYFFGSDASENQSPGVDWDAYRQSLLDILRSGDIEGSEYDPRNRRVERSNIVTEIAQVTNFDLLENFTICPDQPEFRHPDNCTMSTSFLAAANSRLTVGNAIEQGILDGGLTFINPEDLLKNFSDDCYVDALCHSNLVKLRKANIIPIGWEMAAERSPITSPVTLQQAIDCFEDFNDGRGNCRFGTSTDYMVDGEGHNPFYHLVDPNWVLKVPAATCDAYVYSQVLESDDSTNRQQYCADVKTCLREDNNGNCIEDNYGYCVKSENIWSFDGDICEDGELFSGCLNFSNREAGKNSYIEGSLEYCTSDEVGCKRYSQQLDTNNNWVFDDIADDTDDLFLSTAPECPSNQAGCNEYIIMAPDTNANLIPNGDFEIWTDTSALPDGFSETATVTSTGGVAGSNAVLASWISTGPSVTNLACQKDVTLVPNTNYAVSVDAKINQALPGNGPARIQLDGCRDLNGNDGGVSVAFDNPYTTAENDNASAILNDEISVRWDVSELSVSEYTRISGAFNSGNSVSCDQICVGANYGNGNPHLFDNLKMEIISRPKNNTSFSDYGDGAKIYLNGDTFMCTQEEVGCMGYQPSNGDPMIPAVIDQGDLCPQECVGYSTFAEELTYFDIAEDPGQPIEYHNFIPSTAQSCPLQQVGCDEFTNLDEVAAGGEGTEYYSYLRQCVNEEDGKVYFTWEGSDVAGYQLKRWVALPSNEPDWDPAGTYIEEREAPCTNVDFNNNCVDTPGNLNITNMAVCGPATPSILDDPEFDPNCREFIDADGNSFFRLQDRVIFASNDCKDFRRTSTNQIYRALPELSRSCDAVNNGCRLYVGDTDNNLRQVFSDNFENGSFNPWTSSADLNISTESLNLNGRSMRGSANGTQYRRVFSEEPRFNRDYELSFWMKGEPFINSLNVELEIRLSSGGPVNISMDTSSDFQNIEAGNWNYFKTSVYLDEASLSPAQIQNFESMAIYIQPNPGTNGYVYFDNIILKEVIKNTSVVKNSWQTPASCDTPFSGYHLGCQLYTDLNGNKYNLKSFNSLCREEAIGCLPAFETQNSSYPFEMTYHESFCSDGVSDEATCSAPEVWTEEYSEITVPEDRVVYLVPSRQNYCPVNYKGCQALGLQDREDPEATNTVYRINNPDTYNTTLCYGDSLNCSAWESDKGTYYFIDPAINTCTYKEDVNIDGIVVSGWFSDFSKDEVTGNPFGCSDVSVPPSWYDASGAFEFDDLDPNTSTARTCPSDKNLCTGFKDASSPADCDPSLEEGDYICRNTDPNVLDVCSMLESESDCTGVAPADTCEWVEGVSCDVYYYYNNNDLNEGTCNGLVDPTIGCMLFYEENNWNGEHSEVVSLYDANQTYYQSTYQTRAVSPIVCGDFDPLCELNSNRLIQVKQDRQCSEWLACKSSSVVFDENTDSYRVICDEVGACNEYSGTNNITSCGNWVTVEQDEIVPLSTEFYQARGSGPNNYVTWSDADYTGYAVPNMLPVSELTTHNFSDDNDVSNTRLVYGYYDQTAGGNRYNTQCVSSTDPDISDDFDGSLCTANINSSQFTGECNEGLCWLLPVAGQTSTSTYNKQTRGYAIIDSPFPKDIQIDSVRKSGYSDANVCIDIEGEGDNSCEDNFVKVTYGEGGSVKYYPKNESGDIMDGICLSGKVGLVPLPGSPGEFYEVDCTVPTQWKCNTQDEDGVFRQDGMCQEKTKVEVVNNWPGVCLDYDYSTPLVGEDGETDYYCNLWYPVNKIQGANSLYNNYKEAGYFNEDGNDIFYCAIAEPFVLFEDRYYCGSVVNDTCGTLFKVPEGARVNMSALSGVEEILSYGYLKTGQNSSFEYRPSSTLDMGLNDGSNNRPPLPLGMETVVKTPTTNDHNPNNGVPGPGRGYWENRFNLLDFVIPDGYTNIPTITLEEIQLLFDAEIDIFYYDEDIWHDGDQNGGGRVRMPNARTFSDRECDDPPVDQVMKNRNHWCDPEEHIIYSRFYYGGSKCSTFGPRHHNGRVECNPLPYNYYVKAVSPNPTVDCQDFNCSSTSFDGFCEFNPSVQCTNDTDCSGFGRCLTKGISCISSAANPVSRSMWENALYNSTSSANGYCSNSDARCANDSACGTGGTCRNWPWPESIVNLSSELDCNGNINCQFLRCVEELRLGGALGTHEDVFATGTPPTSIPLTGVTYCSDFGKIVYESTESGDLNMIGIDGCYDRLMQEDSYTLPDGTVVSIPDWKIGVNQLLTDELFGTATTEGCLTSDVPAACTVDTSVKNYGSCRREGGWQGPIVCDSYMSSVLGNDCTDEDDCYYQCGVVTELDADGDNSWVRTDIWWRSKNSEEGRMQPVTGPQGTPWEMRYYDPNTGQYSSYSQNTSYYFIKDGDNLIDTFRFFGGAIGASRDELVVTRINYNPDASVRDFMQNTAATFFYATTTNNPFLEEAFNDQNVDGLFNVDVAQNMVWLVGRAYNLQWNGQEYVNPEEIPGAGSEIPHIYNLHGELGSFSPADTGIANPIMGDDYDPRILKACPNGYCEVTDASGNLLYNLEGFTVNDQALPEAGNSNIHVIGRGGTLFTAIKFYYHAHPDHMPIRDIQVDWGDGISSEPNYKSSPGKYKNSLKDCGPDLSLPKVAGEATTTQGFGGTDGACREGYTVLYHTYEYKDGLDNCQDVEGAPPIALGKEATCYKPKIRVIDNFQQATEFSFDGAVAVFKD